MSTYRTAWTKKQQSSVPSDRIKPSSNSSQNQKGKGKNNAPKEPPKSRRVRELESLLSAIRASQLPKKDPQGGCFCQAREHALSSHTPICRTCGLIICNINQPHFACPHCSASLLTGPLRDALIDRLQTQLSETIAREIAAKERAIEEAKREAGAFPTLGGGTSRGLQPSSSASNSRSVTPQPQPSTHKVISVNSKTKKVMVSSYTTTPVSSRPASRSEAEEEEAEEAFVRFPPPPTEVSFVHRKPDPARPWVNLRGGNAKYVAPPVQEDGATGGSRKGRRRKGKAKENENEAVGSTDNKSVRTVPGS